MLICQKCRNIYSEVFAYKNESNEYEIIAKNDEDEKILIATVDKSGVSHYIKKSGKVDMLVQEMVYTIRKEINGFNR